MIFRRFLSDRSGVAGVEMALITPLLVTLMFGSMELGNLYWTQHKLTKAVRDGSRFAARQSFTLFDCGTDTISTSTLTQYPLGGSDLTLTEAVQYVTVYGELAEGTAKVAGWTIAEVTVGMNCASAAVDGSADTEVTTGIYAGMANAPIVTVTADDVPYPSLFEAVGLIDSSITLDASAQAAVMGI